MDFSLSDDQVMIQDMARKFAAERLAPFAMQWDEEKSLDRAVFTRAAALGFCGIYLSESHGGAGLSRLDSALVFEALAAGDISHTAMMTIHNMASRMIDLHGDENLRAKYVPRLASGELICGYCLTEPASGSDAAAMKTRAVMDGDDYLLTGSKSFISGGGWNDLYVVMAKADAGPTAFVVEKAAPGLSFGANEKKMGWNAQPTAQVIMDECRIPASNRIGAEGDGFKFAMQGLDGGRVNIAACSLGGAAAALGAALDYAKTREQFGKPISAFQNTQFKLADMATDLEAARVMVYRAADMLDKNAQGAGAACAMAKRFATDICSKIADDALQIHGGYGYLRDYQVERIVRDLRVHQILEGTNEIMRVIISRDLLRD